MSKTNFGFVFYFNRHGGLSPSIHYLDQIRIIDRFREIPHEGAFVHFLLFQTSFAVETLDSNQNFKFVTVF